MKILIFTGYFYPHIGGMESYVFNLAKELIKRKHEVYIICPNTEKSKNFEILEEIRIIRLPSINAINSFPIVYSYNKLIELKKEKFDLVITNTRFFHTSLIGMNYAKKNKIPLIHIEHGAGLIETKNPVIWIVSRIVDLTYGKIILNNADRIIAISDKSKEFISNFSKNRKISVIKNGIMLVNTRKFRFRKNIRDIIFVGRLVYSKGVQDLIIAFSKLDNNNLRLIVVGEGPYKKKLIQIISKYNIQDKVKFLGEKPKNEIYDLLLTSDLFVNPSYSEGLPTSILEAGMVGLPVIATDIGGTNEIIIDKQNGLLVKPKNPIELQKKIESILNNKKKRVYLASNLNKTIKEKFDWNMKMNEWDILLNNIKKEHSSQ